VTLEIHHLDPHRMETFLERRRATLAFTTEMNLAENLAEILRKANEFVPSLAGSILLDNPLDKKPVKTSNMLTFVAAFGEKATSLIGRQISGENGIAGRVYTTGQAHHASVASEDKYFYSDIDRLTDYETRSLIAIPIRIEQEVCGVLELINRQGARDFSDEDRNLLQIFAGYISISIQNILDGRRAQELAMRDNLTGLFNDHYLHVALERAITECLEANDDLAVVFLDLDYFKRVNDSHGHLAGSQVLREVGYLLQSHVQRPGSIPARYGGDEFVVAIPGIELEKALDLAETLRVAILDTTFCAKPGDIQREALELTGITCSIGVATLHRHIEPHISVGEAKSNLLRLADMAMYVAKETGRNRTAVAGEPVRRRRIVDTESRYRR
jgi:diguanylate cyclase (GGDEF)-like protein